MVVNVDQSFAICNLQNVPQSKVYSFHGFWVFHPSWRFDETLKIENLGLLNAV